MSAFFICSRNASASLVVHVWLDILPINLHVMHRISCTLIITELLVTSTNDVGYTTCCFACAIWCDHSYSGGDHID